MTRLTKGKSQRGSALILVIIVSSLLALMGVAALRLSAQESVEVNRKIDQQILQACATAAQKKIWAEYALYGGSSASIAPTVVPGTNTRLSIGHFDADVGGVSVAFDDKTMKPLESNAASGGLQEMDQSNTFRKGLLGQPYMIFAHCTDGRGRQYEVELLVRFGI